MKKKEEIKAILDQIDENLEIIIEKSFSGQASSINSLMICDILGLILKNQRLLFDYIENNEQRLDTLELWG